MEVVVAADARWPQQFAEMRALLLDVLGSHAVSVEHIGSTAVPGLAAKPTIDVLKLHFFNDKLWPNFARIPTEDHPTIEYVELELEPAPGVTLVVGDNGQGKTTFLRTICGSLEPKAGSLKWGYGCQMGVYAQHVYTTLPQNDTVEDYLHRQAAHGTNMQQIKDVAAEMEEIGFSHPLIGALVARRRKPLLASRRNS